jgi:hypothetical protein
VAIGPDDSPVDFWNRGRWGGTGGRLRTVYKYPLTLESEQYIKTTEEGGYNEKTIP